MIVADALAFAAAGLVALWGVAHAIPTRSVVDGFGTISRDNRLYITQEWLAEAFTMWFIAAVIVVVASLTGPDQPVVAWLYRITAVMLPAVATLTAATGARTPVIWFKICPVLLGSTAALLIAASLL